MNLNHTRRDTGNTKFRIDYSGVGGDWNAAFDSPGIQLGNSLCRRAVKRFFAERWADWRNMYKNAETHKSEGERQPDEEVDTLLFWDTVENCEFEGEDYEFGFGAYVKGKFKADFICSFSMIASMDNVFKVAQANGWLTVDGESDLTLSIGGVGETDLDNPDKGNQAYTKVKPTKLKGLTLNPSGNTWMTFQRYVKADYMLASFNDTDGGASSHSAPYFDGKLRTRVMSDFGDFDINFPPNPKDNLDTKNPERDDNKVSMDNGNVICNSRDDVGRYALSTSFKFGLMVDLGFFRDLRLFQVPIIDVSMRYRTFTTGASSRLQTLLLRRA
ncbi:hypothetical protein BGZ61DRAFT_460648 [Ilyonectria robusta]|uniref:uncharacterized protein n=1 Tax=Ilyonectria robusta TaxID=1079257 RepID=UPI001E8DE8FC|nr:uncharacterized protein BGZ61DRAFT_460648 [Ilyonectria robusta]KAH8669255.1 hypothetical protein BGZ61DRAFT_460648 [Ilyonectria robusta]